jgi:hypothetical protein
MRRYQHPPIDWTVMDGPVMVCLRCHERKPLTLPMNVKIVVKQLTAFSLLHEDCKKPQDGKE